MRRAALLAAVLATAALAPAAAGDSVDPRLAVFAGDPVGVRGKHFKPGEQVTVTFAAGAALRADPPRWRYRVVIADAEGLFTVRFRELKLTPCKSYRAGARGDQGSRAFVERRVTCPSRARE